YKATFGNTKYTIPKGLPPFESVTDVKTVESFMEALETAMKNERNAHDLYMYLAKENKENRKLFKYLAKTELGHYEALKQDFNFFGSEFKGEPKAKISLVYANTLFRSLDVEK
ncbi:MAG: ferritin family protein, partial [Thermoplasmata archaeon]